jgi:hypothetical protein
MGKLDGVAKVNGKIVATCEGIMFLIIPPNVPASR